MADYQAEQVTSAGLDPTPHPANQATGDTVPPDVTLRVINGGGAPITLTVPTPGTVDGLAIADRTVPVPNGEFRYVRLPRSPYRDPDDGRVHLSWSDDTSVTFEVIR